MQVYVFCAPVHVYGQSDKCWTAVVLDFNATELHCLLVGGTDYWQGVWEAWNGQQRNRGTVMMRVGVEEV